MIHDVINNLSDVEFSKPPKVRLHPNRMKNVPKFTLKDITGEFSSD